MFGHEKGAFRGPLPIRFGRFELADKGTLSLTGDRHAFGTAAKLLRVLQEREFEKLGKHSHAAGGRSRLSGYKSRFERVAWDWKISRGPRVIA